MQQQTQTITTTNHVGVVDNTVEHKGFGFIRRDNGKLYFFHQRDTKDRIVPPRGTVVQFTAVPVGIEGKNDRAINVEVIQ